MWYSMLWGSRRALPLSSMSVCVCMCVFVCMCYGNEERRGDRDGASHTLGMSQAVVDLQQWRPPRNPFEKLRWDSAIRQPDHFLHPNKQKKKKTALRLRAAPNGNPLSPETTHTEHPKPKQKWVSFGIDAFWNIKVYQRYGIYAFRTRLVAALLTFWGSAVVCSGTKAGQWKRERDEG